MDLSMTLPCALIWTTFRYRMSICPVFGIFISIVISVYTVSVCLGSVDTLMSCSIP